MVKQRIDNSGSANIPFNGNFKEWAETLHLRAQGDAHVEEYRKRIRQNMSDKDMRLMLFRSWIDNGFDRTESARMFNVKI